jgi:hypothetical protein
MFVWEGLSKPLQVVRQHVDSRRGLNMTGDITHPAEQKERLNTYLETDREARF